MLQKVKTALRISTDLYDGELKDLIAAATEDLGIAGIDAESLVDNSLVVQAIKTYCRMNFGSPTDYDRLKRSYDEQKAQMQTATGYGL